MSRSWIGLLALLVVAAVGVGCSSTNANNEAEGGAGSADLEARVQQLERELEQCQTRLAEAGALENDAQQAYTEINKLVEEGKFDQAKAKMDVFQQKYGATRVGRSAARMAQELQVLGKSTPSDWHIEKWYQGESDVDLASGKPTLVVFWETWCPHCRREVPKLQTMYDQYKDQGLQLLGVTRLTKNSTEETVKSFIAENKVSYPIAKEDGELANYFAVRGIPAAAVVKNGKVVWRGHPARISDEMLKGWL